MALRGAVLLALIGTALATTGAMTQEPASLTALASKGDVHATARMLQALNQQSGELSSNQTLPQVGVPVGHTQELHVSTACMTRSGITLHCHISQAPAVSRLACS